MHYQRMRKTGSVGSPHPRVVKTSCDVEECTRAHYARGLCKTHYNTAMRITPPSQTGAPVCMVDGCGLAHYGNGFCRKHWERDHKFGDPSHRETLNGASLTERVEHYSKRVGNCLEWQGHRTRDGYGAIWVDGHTRPAHRVSYELRFGSIPDGLMIRHKCDNPPCIDPDHLEVGTNADNMRDKVERGRGPSGEANPAAKLTMADVVAVRRLVSRGFTQRHVARMFGLGQSHLSRIVRGESWSS